jgi:putative addiction module killer protein
MRVFPRELRVYETESGKRPFEEWLTRLKDETARARIRERIARLMLGNFGDCRGVGEGVLELRIAFGAGYRVYVAQDGKTVIVLLCGGDKSSQKADIKRAKALWAHYRRLTRNA